MTDAGRPAAMTLAAGPVTVDFSRMLGDPTTLRLLADLAAELEVPQQLAAMAAGAAVGVWVGVGSRDEGRSVAGAAHFLEHLLFKSTPTRTAVDIAQAVDAVGGELNAFTAREQTCYYAHVLDSDLELAVDALELRPIPEKAHLVEEARILARTGARRRRSPDRHG